MASRHDEDIPTSRMGMLGLEDEIDDENDLISCFDVFKSGCSFPCCSSAKQTGFIQETYDIDTREYLKPKLKDHSTVIGQIVYVEKNLKPPIKHPFGTGFIIQHPSIDIQAILTSAHNLTKFIHAQSTYSVYFYLMRDSKDFHRRIRIKFYNITIHPNYNSDLKAISPYDIAVVSLNEKFYLEDEYFPDPDEYRFVGIDPSEHDLKGVELRVTGYPGEKEMQNKLYTATTPGKCEDVLMFKDGGYSLKYLVSTSSGQSGSPVSIIGQKVNNTVCGVHCHADQTFNYAVLIDKELHQWIMKNILK